ncbi:extensin-like [Aquila chrysaetos chrysaetos]|uniref:extensin-like n=1 Tax=Aquila chrysaetos chrysaetos TaxID=223781 RepID=UPI0011772643|nr:extensin-like [Aquila chrysaetos chrysaetos]
MTSCIIKETSSPQLCGSRRAAAAGKGSSGVTPPPRRVPVVPPRGGGGPFCAPSPTESSPVPTVARVPRRGPGLAVSPPAGTASSRLNGCYLPVALALGRRVLPPAAGLPACLPSLPRPPPLTAAPVTGTCARPGRLPSAYGPGCSTAIEQNTAGSAPSRHPPAPIGWPARPPNFDPLCHRTARRAGPAHKGRGAGPVPGRDSRLWCRAGRGGRAGLQPPAGVAAARRPSLIG